MAGWTTKLLTISTIVFSATWESRADDIPTINVVGPHEGKEGIPPHLVVPHDFLTLDPYTGDPLLDAPISISDDANNVFQTPFDSDFSHQNLHTSFPFNKIKPAQSSHQSTDIQLLNPIHSFTSIHSPQLIPPIHSHHSIHSSKPSFSTHSSKPSLSIHSSKPSHSTHSVKLPHSTHSVKLPQSTHSFKSHHSNSPLPVHLPPSTIFADTSASSLHPQYPHIATSHLGYDPYLYTHPVADEGVYFPEHGYNVLDKLGAVHDDNYDVDHHFPPLGYNLDPYFNDFPIFGYFDFTPEYDHHRHRRGTSEPHTQEHHQAGADQQHRQPRLHQDLKKNALPLLHRVPRNKRPTQKGHSRMPQLPQVREMGGTSDFL